ncbi:MAG TPA: amino acid permease, partial [Chitinophagaceae bacterium]|nr:amino acid permease [Chitinophagaceae bacterium]
MSTQGLSRQIGFWTAVSVIAGSIIGSGIFIKPQAMAALLQSPVWLLLVWVLAGIFSFAGALIYAELGALWPHTGGLYVYFRKLFGDFTAFLYGWAAFAVINTAAVAAIAFVCAQYADYFLHLPRLPAHAEQAWSLYLPFIGTLYPLQNLGVKLLAILLVIVFTLLNYFSVRGGGRFQLFSSAVKLLVIGGLAGAVFLSGEGSFTHFLPGTSSLSAPEMINAVVLAMTGAFYAYDGWINITFMAGEVRHPQRNIPRSLAAGVLICMIAYVLINMAYLYAMPVEAIADSPLVAADAVTLLAGRAAGTVTAALIVICTLGAINGNLMASSRVTFAMSREKVFLPAAGRIHPEYHTPGNSLMLHGAWICLYIFTGSFDMLADIFVFITWIAYGLGAAGIFLI